jgi:transcriptional regulator of acetoin/glycerol metabolism
MVWKGSLMNDAYKKQIDGAANSKANDITLGNVSIEATDGGRRLFKRGAYLGFEAIVKALDGNTLIKAASILGISRKTLYRKMKGYGLV